MNIEIVEVPEFNADEIKGLCVENLCPSGITNIWSIIIAARTNGHPKLVQVHLSELVDKDWPNPKREDIIVESSSLKPVRQMARQLLSQSLSPVITEFVYLVSMSSVLLHRSVALRLAETVEGLTNAGDVLDNLTGKWIERIESEWYRTTALLSDSVTEVWSPDRLKQNHIRLHDAIRAKQTFAPFEAAALLFHAFMGNDQRRLAYNAMKLQLIEGEEARSEVQKNLLWLPYVALKSGEAIADHPMTGIALRGLQFQVALTLDSDCLPQIIERWSEDIEKLTDPLTLSVNRCYMWLNVAFKENRQVPLKPRLEAIIGFPGAPKEILEQSSELGEQFFNIFYDIGGLPQVGTTTQAILLCASSCIRTLSALEELLEWLDNVASEDIKQQFDEMIEWPFVQSSGAFIHGAWSAVHEQTEDWMPWMVMFDRVDDYAIRNKSPRIGREAAKAKSIILNEFLSQSKEAIKVLEKAEESFGPSAILLEQKSNVLFHNSDDEAVLELWSTLTSDVNSSAFFDPFAYRRAGISAARLQRWDVATQILHDGANSINSDYLNTTKFGLQVDEVLAMSNGGDKAHAAMLLAEAILSLPSEAEMEGHERWDALQRAAVAVCRAIEDSIWKSNEHRSSIEVGYASSPTLKTARIESGQAARTTLTKVQVFLLTSKLTNCKARFTEELEDLASSNFFMVRWLAVQAQLALHYSTGAGQGFIQSLLNFDRITADATEGLQQGRPPLVPDDGPRYTLSIAPERWLGLLLAGIVCFRNDPIGRLKIWLDESNQLLGEEAKLTQEIHMVLEGASLPAQSLYKAATTATNPASLRCGAAAQILQEVLPAMATLRMQRLLASGFIVDESYVFQQLFNQHVARSFAHSWRIHAQRPFQFVSPRASVPALLNTLDNVERGNGTLKSVLNGAAVALMEPLGKFMDRVL